MRWRPKFKLRTLLIAIVVCGIFFSWCTSILVRVQNQRRVAVRLLSLDCNVLYDWHVEYRSGVLSPPGWKPLRWIFGEDAFSYIASVGNWKAGKLTNEDVPQLCELPELQLISLQGEAIANSGVVALAKLKKLRELTLADTSISSSALASFSKCPSLESLVLSGLNVDERLLEGIGQLHSLKSLSLKTSSPNRLGLQDVARLSGLQKLAVDGHSISEEEMELLAALPNLEVLRLSNARIEVACSTRMNNLTTLVLQFTPAYENSEVLRPGELRQLARLHRLEELSLQGSPVNDNTIAEIAWLKNLVSLDLKDSSATDLSLPVLAQIRSLRRVNLRGTRISDSGLLQLAALEDLERLTISPTISKSAAQKLKDLLPHCVIECTGPPSSQEFVLP